MPVSPVYRVRIEDRLKALIDAQRGGVSVSAWLRTAAAKCIEEARGLGPDFAPQLAAHHLQLRGLAANLNQLAKTANQGQPVIVNDTLLTTILDEIRATRSLLNDINSRLPE
jgi:hypothetical protein